MERVGESPAPRGPRPLVGKLVHPLVAAGALGLASAVVCAAFRKLGDFDLPWHLATGRAVASAGLRYHPIDDLSYTFRGAPLHVEYLSDLLLWGAFRLAGPLGLHLVSALAIAALTVLLVLRGRSTAMQQPDPHRAASQHSNAASQQSAVENAALQTAGAASQQAATADAALHSASAASQKAAAALTIAATALALIASGSWLVVRPALLSFAFFAAALHLIDRHRRGAGNRSLALLVPLQLAWANCHGFATLGALAAIGYALHTVSCRLVRGRLGGLFPVEEGARAASATVIALAATLATCLSSYGTEIFTQPARLRGYGALITEWAPLSLDFVLRHDPSLLVLFGFVVLGLAAGRASPSVRTPALFDLALCAGTLALAIAGVRLIPIFAICAAPLCARRLALVAANARGLFALAALSGLCAAPALLLSPGTHPGIGFDEKNLPEAACRFVASQHLAGPVFNFLPFGGDLAFRLHPDVRVFVDGRTGWLYPRDFVEDAMRAQHDPALFERLSAKWGFEWAVLRAAPGERFGEPIASDPRWTLVFLDECAAIYVRKAGENRALAERGYRVLTHLTPAGVLLFQPPSPAADFAHDAALAVAQAPDSPRAHFIAAAAALARNDLATARAERSAIFALDPDYPGLAPLDSLLAPTR